MSEDVVRLAMRRMADQDGEQWILDIDVSVEPLDGRTPPPGFRAVPWPDYPLGGLFIRLIYGMGYPIFQVS